MSSRGTGDLRGLLCEEELLELGGEPKESDTTASCALAIRDACPSVDGTYMGYHEE